MNKIVLTVVAAAGLAGAAQADIVAAWNFNTLSIATAGLPGTGTIPTTIAASTGTGSLSLAGWTGNVDDFGGSTVNAVSGDVAGVSLSLLGGGTGTNNPGNGGVVTWSVDLSDFENPVVSFATQRTSTGFNSNQFAFSTDGGTTWTNVGAAYTPASAYALVSFDLSANNTLDFAPSALFRLTFTGATSAAGNNRVDNLRVDATFVPTPGAAALLGLGALAAGRRRR
jgi:MYXO-CTERM domain-containing protein